MFGGAEAGFRCWYLPKITKLDNLRAYLLSLLKGCETDKQYAKRYVAPYFDSIFGPIVTGKLMYIKITGILLLYNGRLPK